MSHNIKLSGVRIKDMNLLGQVVNDMSGGKAKLDMNQKTFRTEAMLGGTNKCDACIVMPGERDIGLMLKDGAYTPVYAAMGMTQLFRGKNGGTSIGGLLQEYALREAEYEAAQKGFSSERVEQPNGTVTLELIEVA